jgi:hypothetical protein
MDELAGTESDDEYDEDQGRADESECLPRKYHDESDQQDRSG